MQLAEVRGHACTPSHLQPGFLEPYELVGEVRVFPIRIYREQHSSFSFCRDIFEKHLHGLHNLSGTNLWAFKQDRGSLFGWKFCRPYSWDVLMPPPPPPPGPTSCQGSLLISHLCERTEITKKEDVLLTCKDCF